MLTKPAEQNCIPFPCATQGLGTLQETSYPYSELAGAYEAARQYWAARPDDSANPPTNMHKNIERWLVYRRYIPRCPSLHETEYLSPTVDHATSVPNKRRKRQSSLEIFTTALSTACNRLRRHSAPPTTRASQNAFFYGSGAPHRAWTKLRRSFTISSPARTTDSNENSVSDSQILYTPWLNDDNHSGAVWESLVEDAPPFGLASDVISGDEAHHNIIAEDDRSSWYFTVRTSLSY